MLTLSWFGTTTVPVEAECIRPDLLTGKSNSEIERLLVQHGNRQRPLAEFFRVSGDAVDQCITIEGDVRRVKWIGADMSRGQILIDGDVGTHLGSAMSGGRITVKGNAGDWVGGEMRGGLIQIHGNAGHQTGAAYRGSRRGMRGGTILIHGSSGNEIGGTMRRGLIAVAGDAGDFAGVSMIAGTIILGRSLGQRAGAGMKRGTIAALRPGDALHLLPTFRFDCEYGPVFLELYRRQLEGLGFPWPTASAHRNFLRFSGDLVALGRGEILAASS